MTPLISAHRGGAGDDVARENTLEALLAAVRTGCEYVEVDVQRCRDGVHVVHHGGARVRDGGRRVPVASLTFAEFVAHADTYLLLDDALEVLRGRKKAHLDLKFLSERQVGGSVAPGHEVALVQHVIDALGPENVIVTTLEDESVRAVRAWSKERYPELLVGLSLNRDVVAKGLRALIRTRFGEILPRHRIGNCDANLVVCHRALARLWGARWAKRHGLPLLVWTVDDSDELRTWLSDGRAWMVTTNFPQRALDIRAELTRRTG